MHSPDKDIQYELVGFIWWGRFSWGYSVSQSWHLWLPAWLAMAWDVSGINLVMLNLFQEIQTYIYIYYHFSTQRWNRKFNICLVEHNVPFIMHGQCLSICSTDGLVQNKRKAINWTNNDQVHWHRCTSLGFQLTLRYIFILLHPSTNLQNHQ